MVLSDKDVQRFYSHVDARGEQECWNWKGGKTSEGYGKFSVARDSLLAHRVAWQIANGRAPREGYDIAHAPVICHNPSCCNPSHLSEKTKSENQADRLIDGTASRGEKNGSAKLSWEKVFQIRELGRKGVTQTARANIFEVSQATISLIDLNEIWRV